MMDGQNLINDLSDLINIKNVNGDETFTQEGNKLVWNADGADIYYQGETKKELPIEVKIKYELDGKEISSKEIAGKSGKVKITIEYKNKDSHVVTINGKQETLYTPFVVVCGTILDNTIHKNIDVSSGKVVDDGNKSVVMGMSFPGLNESLGISSDKLDLPNKIEITMDSKEFEISNIASFITPKILEDSDLSIFDDLDEIHGKVNTLQSSSNQLVQGTGTLKEGTDTFYAKSKEFNSAMKQVSSGANRAKSSYSEIDNGISLIAENSVTLENGAKQVSEGTQAVSDNLATISGGVQNLQEGAVKLETGTSEIEKGINTIGAVLDKINLSDNSAKITELKTLIEANKKSITTLENINKSLEAELKNSTDEKVIKGIKEQQMTNKSVIYVLNQNIKANSETIKTLELSDVSTLQNLKEALTKLTKGITAIKSGATELANGAGTLKNGTDKLCTETSKLASGAKTLYQGTVTLSKGTKTLNSGSKEMKKGLYTLSSGTSSLETASNSLTEGAETISSGATTLAEGMNKFNQEGIQTICNYINSNLKDVSERVQKLQDLANKYNNFTMLDGSSSGNVKFIVIMDAIKKNDDNKEQAIIVDKK